MKVQGTSGHIYKGIVILPADTNSSGIRWSARLTDGTRLRSDTLAGMKQMITDKLTGTSK